MFDIGTAVIETEGFFKGSEFTYVGGNKGTNPKWGERNLISPTIPAAPKVRVKLTGEQRAERASQRISELSPETVSPTLLGYLHTQGEAVWIRFSWPPSVDDAVRELFCTLDIPLPENARAINSGERGGEPMYSLSSEVHFPTPPDASILPEGARVSERVDVSRVSFALGLAKERFKIHVTKTL
jgi:hypothetical protein